MNAASGGSGPDLIGPAITDVAGEPAGQTQVERLVARYHWTASYCADQVVLEVACGTGQGLGLLRTKAKLLFGCDLSTENLNVAGATYGRLVQLLRANAQTLPFADKSVDVVVLLETVYFLPSADDFLAEASRVLKPGGHLLISSINKDCPDFNPNHPLYFARYGVVDLTRKLESHGYTTQSYGIIPMDKPTFRSRAFKPVKKLAVSLNLIPESMQARRLLKRIVFGVLTPMPRDIASLAPPPEKPVKLPSDRPDTLYQVILYEGTRSA